MSTPFQQHIGMSRFQRQKTGLFAEGMQRRLLLRRNGPLTIFAQQAAILALESGREPTSCNRHRALLSSCSSAFSSSYIGSSARLGVLPALFAPWTHPEKLVSRPFLLHSDRFVSKQRIDLRRNFLISFGVCNSGQDGRNEMTARLASACGQSINCFEHRLRQRYGNSLHDFPGLPLRLSYTGNR